MKTTNDGLILIFSSLIFCVCGWASYFFVQNPPLTVNEIGLCASHALFVTASVMLAVLVLWGFGRLLIGPIPKSRY